MSVFLMENKPADRHTRQVWYEKRSALSCKHAVAVLFAFLFLFTCSHRVFSLPIMGPETGPRIESLISRSADRFPLPDGWDIAGYHYTDFDVFVRLEKPTGAQAVFRLACTSLPSKNTLVGESRNFRMELSDFSGVSAPETLRVGDSLLERIKHNDQPLFFDQPDMQNREGIYEFLFRKYLFIPLIFAGFAAGVLLLLVGFPLIRKHLLPGNVVCAVILAFLLIAGAALRFGVGPGAPVHNNGHGVRELRSILYTESPEQKEMLYGSVYTTLMKSLAGVAGNTDSAVFNINRILGTLAVLGMFMLARALLFSETAALTAAAAFSFNPGLVWLSGSESPASMYLFFALSGFAFTVVSAKTRSWRLLWLSLIFICAASTMRLLTMAAAPVAILLFVYSSYQPASPGNDAGDKNSFKQHALLCFGILIVWLCFHCLTLDPDNAANGIARISASMYLHNMRIYNILFDPTLTPACLPFFAATGFLLLLWKRPVLAALLAVVFVLIVPVSFTTMADRTDFLRYQPQTHWLYFLLTASLVDFIAKSSLSRRIADVVALSVPAAVVMFSIAGLTFLAAGNEEIAEYRFISNMSASLPPGTGIALPVRPDADERMISDFPDYQGRFKLNKTGIIGRKTDELIYTGLDCYRYNDMKEMSRKAEAGGMRPECASICGGHPIPVREKKLKVEIPDSVLHRRYFMLGTDRPVIGFYKCPEHVDNKREGN